MSTIVVSHLLWFLMYFLFSVSAVHNLFTSPVFSIIFNKPTSSKSFFNKSRKTNIIISYFVQKFLDRPFSLMTVMNQNNIIFINLLHHSQYLTINSSLICPTIFLLIPSECYDTFYYLLNCKCVVAIFVCLVLFQNYFLLSLFSQIPTAILRGKIYF